MSKFISPGEGGITTVADLITALGDMPSDAPVRITIVPRGERRFTSYAIGSVVVADDVGEPGTIVHVTENGDLSYPRIY